MDKSLLVTRPKYDDGTEYLSAYALEVIKEARKNNLSVKDLEQADANKSNVEKYIHSKNPKLVFLNGHGNNDEIYGHKDEVIFSRSNVSLLKNKIVYARACLSGNALGKEIARDSEGCFIGYIYPFSFWIDSKWSAKPLNDKTASLYLRPSNEVMLRLIKGRSAGEADKESKKMMIDNMRKLLILEKKQEPGATAMLEILWGNYEGQVVLGNKEAKF